MRRRTFASKPVCLLLCVALLTLLAGYSVSKSSADGSAQSHRVLMNSLELAAGLLQERLEQITARFEAFGTEYLYQGGSSLGGSAGQASRSILLTPFVQSVSWVDTNGSVLKTIPASDTRMHNQHIDPLVLELMEESLRSRTPKSSKLDSLPGAKRGLWIVVPITGYGGTSLFVIGAVDLGALDRVVKPLEGQTIFVMDDEGAVSRAVEDWSSLVNWRADVLGDPALSSSHASVLDLVKKSTPAIAHLTEPGASDGEASRKAEVIVAPFQLLSRKFALCSLQLLAAEVNPAGAEEHPTAVLLVLLVAAALLVVATLVLLNKRTASVEAPRFTAVRKGVIELAGAVISGLDVPVVIANKNGFILAASEALRKMLVDTKRPTIVGVAFEDIFAEPNRGKMRGFLSAVLAVGHAETNVSLPIAEREDVDIRLKGFTLDLEGEDNLLIRFDDKPQRSSRMDGNASRNSDLSDPYLDSVLNGLSEAVMILGPDYKITKANSNMAGLSGSEMETDIVGRNCYEVLHGTDVPCNGKGSPCCVKEVMKQMRPIGLVHHLTKDDGSQRFIEVFACPIGTSAEKPEILVSLRDITEKTQLSMQLAKADRLKALGQMASGVAHDFNNLLGVILGRAQLLIRMIGAEDAGARRNLEIIERSALDGAETVRRIQEFAKVGDTSAFVPVDLAQIVEDSIAVTKPRWKDQMQRLGINIQTSVKRSSAPRVAGSPSELREVFLNLINNAIDAMPEGGRLAFEIGTERGRAFVLVSDTGQGIPPSIANRVFDPFFTTKSAQNSGLGLSIVYGIIERHGGSIEVQSNPGHGTTFRIEIPALARDSSVSERPAVKQPTVAPSARKARILIIDDEEDIRNLLVDMLHGEGHSVDVASTGQEGIEKCKQSSFDFVITDLGMPNMSGWEVSKRIKAIQPDVTLILATGWDIRFDEEKLETAGVERVISKPFQIEEVLSCVNVSS